MEVSSIGSDRRATPSYLLQDDIDESYFVEEFHFSHRQQLPSLQHQATPLSPLFHQHQQSQQLHSSPHPVSSPLTSQPVHIDHDEKDNMAKAIGWFSIAIGLMQLLAPRTVARTAGIPEQRTLLRVLGMREMISGIGILSQRRNANWLWSRVAGDAMDLALLRIAAASPIKRPRRVALAVAAVTGVTVADVLSSVRHSRQEKRARSSASAADGIAFERYITVNRPVDECYRQWRDFKNFPRFLRHIESVQLIDDKRSHWKVLGHGGVKLEWVAELTAEQPGRLFTWHTLDGSDFVHEGRVSFELAPGGRGTIVRVQMRYELPGGKGAAMIAKVFGEEPSQLVDGALRHFKQIMETGEIATAVGQPAGARSAFVRHFIRKGAPG